MPAYEVAEKYPDVYAVTGHYLNLMAPDAVAAGMAYTNDAEGQLNTVDVLNMESDNGDVDTHKPLSASEYRAALTKYIADVKAGKYNDTAVDNAQKRVDELQKKVDALQSSKTADAKDVEAAKQELADAKTQAATERQTINDLYTLLNQQSNSQAKHDADNTLYEAKQTAKTAKSMLDKANTAKAEKDAAVKAAADKLAKAQDAYDTAVADQKKAQDAKTKADDTVPLFEQGQARVDQLKAQLDEAKKNLDEARKQADTAADRLDKANLKLAQAQDTLAKAISSAKRAQNVLDERNKTLEEAKANTAKAEQAKQDAGQQVEQAQANLEHVKANLPNAAELKAAEAALAQAKTVQQQAQVKLAAAKAALDKANRQVEQAKAKLTETSTNLVNALKALEDARNAGNATKPGKDMDIDPGYTIPGSEEFGGNTNDGKNDSGDDTITTVISDKTGAHHGKHAAKADAQTTQATRSPRPARTSKRLQPLAS